MIEMTEEQVLKMHYAIVESMWPGGRITEEMFTEAGYILDSVLDSLQESGIAYYALRLQELDEIDERLLELQLDKIANG